MDKTTSTKPLAIATSPVQSSQIAELGYDAASKTMAVRFKGWGEKPGALYHYGNVDQDDYDALRNAESIGAHFGKTIKPNPTRFPYARVDETKRDE